jgi:hypothetical protein
LIIVDVLSFTIPGLDPPLFLYFPRVVIRTLARLFGFREPCAAGCNETWSEAFFSRKSILLFCLSHHFYVRRKMRANLERIGLVEGSGVLNEARVVGAQKRKARRIGGWGGELRVWLGRVDEMVRSR